MAHKCNLAFKTLLTLRTVSSIVDLLQICHAYFAHNPKRHPEFTNLIDTMETNELKMFKNVKTCWISLLDLLKIILIEYRPFWPRGLWTVQATKLPKCFVSTFFSMFIDSNFVCLWFKKIIKFVDTQSWLHLQVNLTLLVDPYWGDSWLGYQKGQSNGIFFTKDYFRILLHL
jgi:hypothetical protein